MPQFDPSQSNFTAGEIAPNVLGNFALEKYKQGLSKAENVIVEAAGGVRRRGGFKYVATVKDSTKDTILVEFQYKNEFFYILEFGNLYIRFYRNQAQIATGGTPTEIVTTYTEAELRELYFTQDEENLYITHKNHAPAKLSRTSHTEWVLVTLPLMFNSGTIWEEYEAAVANNWEAICWSPELLLFVAVSDSGTDDRIMTSPDGVTWTTRVSTVDLVWTDVCWSPELALFCAVAAGGTSNGIMTSPDGITWTTRVPPTDNHWIGVCWSPELTLFCAVAWSGTNDRVMTSPDGITWTTRVSASNITWVKVVWAAEINLFVAIGDAAGGTSNVMTSPDGITWTLRASAADESWMSIAWSPTLRKLVAVSSLATPNSIQYSSDGINWALGTEASATAYMLDVCWSEDFDIFIAVGYSTTGEQVWVSYDGVSWESATPANTNMWNSVCYAPELGVFCAVGEGVNGERTMATTQSISSAWSAGNYPSLCWFFQQRLFFAATPDEPNKVWGSRSANYLNFDTGTGLDNEAISVVIKDVKKLLWATVSNTIVLGASNGIWKLDANNTDEAITPTNIRPLRLTNYGCSSVPALDIAGNSVFLQKGLRKLRKLEYEYVNNRYTAVDFMILGNHLTKSGITELKYIDEPEPIIYGVRTDGELMGITYEPEFKIFGGFRYIIGGTAPVVKSIAVCDATNADQDELWAIISRTIDGGTVQYIEFLTPGLTAEDDYKDSTFMDSFVTKTGAAFTTFDGLDHLEGQTVQVFADGYIQGSKVVASGQITITSAVKAHAGLMYVSTIETLPIEGGNPIGSAMGKIKRISKMMLRLYRSYIFWYGDLLGNTGAGYTPNTNPFTGDTEEIDFYGTHETGGQIKLISNQVYPFNLLAIMYKARTGE